MTHYIGRAKIAYDGKVLDTAKGAKLNLGGVARKEVEGDYTIGHTESLKASRLECEVQVSKDTPVEEINNIVGAVVTFRSDIGRTWTIRNAFRAGDPVEFEANDKGGGMKLVLMGDPAEEV